MVVAAGDYLSCDLAQEAAILDFKSGLYYGLDEVGAHIWKLVSQPLRVSDIRDALLAEYEVDAEACERDVIALLSELAAKGLVEVRNESAVR